jgi:hypothetical protein
LAEEEEEATLKVPVGAEDRVVAVAQVMALAGLEISPQLSQDRGILANKETILDITHVVEAVVPEV